MWLNQIEMYNLFNGLVLIVKIILFLIPSFLCNFIALTFKQNKFQ